MLRQHTMISATQTDPQIPQNDYSATSSASLRFLLNWSRKCQANVYEVPRYLGEMDVYSSWRQVNRRYPRFHRDIVFSLPQLPIFARYISRRHSHLYHRWLLQIKPIMWHS